MRKPDATASFFAKESNRRTAHSTQRVLGSALYLLPLLCAVYVVEPLPPAFTLLLPVLWLLMELGGVRFAGLTLIFLQDIALRHGIAWAVGAAAVYTILAGAILIPCMLKRPEGAELRRRWPEALHGGLTLGAAIMMSFYQCSGYFAVGARGAGMLDLLRGYLGLGFYPNWRTVLFSTVMLVVLITWPRKFKTLSKTLPGGFAGLVLVTALNILLNPVAARSAVAELPLPLPFLRRVPISALSMLLIFAAWEEVPWGKIRDCFKEKRAFAMLLLVLIPAAMFCFDLLWVSAGLMLVWGLQKLACLIHEKRGRVGKGALVPHGQ